MRVHGKALTSLLTSVPNGVVPVAKVARTGLPLDFRQFMLAWVKATGKQAAVHS